MTLEDLFDWAGKGCQNPNCHEDHSDLIMSPVCHGGAPTYFHVNAETRAISLRCADCDKEVLYLDFPLAN